MYKMGELYDSISTTVLDLLEAEASALEELMRRLRPTAIAGGRSLKTRALEIIIADVGAMAQDTHKDWVLTGQLQAQLYVTGASSATQLQRFEGDGIQQQRVQLQSATHFVCEPSRSTAAVLAIKTPDTTKRIFEIRDKSREKSRSRVAVSANRFKEINKRTGWWNALTVGQAPNGEFVVKAPTKVGYLVTADRDFAEREGITPVALARILRDNIVKVFDAMPSLASMRSKENPTPEEKRASAQALRLDADAAFDSDAKRAEELYKKSIEADNTYAEPVLGLAELFIEQKRIDDAKTLLKTSSEATNYPEEDRTKFKNRLKDLG
jgi:hypothetical protein